MWRRDRIAVLLILIISGIFVIGCSVDEEKFYWYEGTWEITLTNKDGEFVDKVTLLLDGVDAIPEAWFMGNEKDKK